MPIMPKTSAVQAAPVRPADIGMGQIEGRETGENISPDARQQFREEMHRMVDVGLDAGSGEGAVVVVSVKKTDTGLAWGWSGNLPRDLLTNWLVERQLEEMLGVLEVDGNLG